MVTKTKDTALPATAPIEWGTETAEVMAGVELVNKAELEGVPFRMTGFKFTVSTNKTTKQQISYVYVEFEREPSGDRYMFNDSSTGIRAQVEAYFTAKGIEIELDKWYDVSIVAPKGVRASEYETEDERGRKVMGKTFYLSTSGGRA
jgi:hypothetical protein